jgi:serine/threonine protein kinase
LLRNHKGEDVFGSIAEHARPLAAGVEKVGDTIGGYKLVRVIGQGGCGIVYEAEQQAPFTRRVALKVMCVDVDPDHVIDRFKSERQNLASLNHSNIAKIYDAGVTDHGCPYFVLELVNGKHITDYCDEHELTIKERLDLFIKVTRTIHDAHLSGIIHRDLKPANILILKEAGELVPKIIDFGIAQAMDIETACKGVHPRIPQRVGTPNYMSPEQAGLGDLTIDRRTDIYSLGVVLYELLVGCLPFQRQVGMESLAETIRDEELLSPSAKLKQMGERERLNVAQKRHCGLSDLDEVVAELDGIVMKCLEEPRDKRYETAHALANELYNYLRPPRTRWGRYAIAGAVVVVAAVTWRVSHGHSTNVTKRLSGDLNTVHNLTSHAIERLENR